MSIWWVNLGQKFAAQMAAKALWCPNKSIGSDGSLVGPRWHWSNITEARPGEFIVLCRKGYIEGLAIVRTEAIENQPKPDGFTFGTQWHPSGWLLPIAFVQFRSPVKRDQFTHGLFLGYQKYSPLHRDVDTGKARGAQIYLTQLHDDDGVTLFERIAQALDVEQPGWLGQLVTMPEDSGDRSASGTAVTIREAIVKARVGQGQFRKDLLSRWSGKCCATGLDVERLLVASHIHPWSLSSNDERLDPDNGLLLSAAYDAAFDEGLITIDQHGNWKVVADLSPAQLDQAGLGRLAQQPVRGLTGKHHAYLARHRQRAEQKAGSANLAA